MADHYLSLRKMLSPEWADPDSSFLLESELGEESYNSMDRATEVLESIVSRKTVEIFYSVRTKQARNSSWMLSALRPSKIHKTRRTRWTARLSFLWRFLVA